MSKLPAQFPKTIQGISDFLKQVIEATSDLCIAYKPNIAFFEGLGIEGLHLLEMLCKCIPSNTPIVLDAKRGDIGNTSAMQAKFIFNYFGAAATTLHPYMGLDSLSPFFDYKDKFHFVLALTSNPGSADFEKKRLENGALLYESVFQQCINWNQTYHNIGVVIGATQSELGQLRKIDPGMLFLIPGVGAQGGDYTTAVECGSNQDQVALINLSRGILYCSSGIDFVQDIRKEMQKYIKGNQ